VFQGGGTDKRLVDTDQNDIAAGAMSQGGFETCQRPEPAPSEIRDVAWIRGERASDEDDFADRARHTGYPVQHGLAPDGDLRLVDSHARAGPTGEHGDQRFHGRRR
jgi:hypothetical protein